MIKPVWSFLVRTLGHHFRGRLAEGSTWEYHADSQISSFPLVQVCTASFPQALIQSVEHLYLIERGFLPLHRQDDIEDSQWLELLRPFTSVKCQYLSKEFTPRIASSLQVLVGGNVIEVLPCRISSMKSFTCTGSHLEVRYHTTALQLPNHHFSQGEELSDITGGLR